MIALGQIVVLRTDPHIGGVVTATWGGVVQVETGDKAYLWLDERLLRVAGRENDEEEGVAYG